MLAYFLPSVILSSYTNAKRQFCLGSITKCHVIRTGGGFQSGAKETPQKQYVICLANYLYYALGRCMVFRFFGSWGRLQTTPSGLQGWMEYATPALQVVIVPYLLGEHKRE